MTTVVPGHGTSPVEASGMHPLYWMQEPAKEDIVGQQKTNRHYGGAGVLFEPGMWDQVRLTWRLFRDERVASRLKVAIPALATLYVLSPIDVIPDLLLGVGQIDDLGVIGLALVLMTRLVPRFANDEIVAEHMAAMGLTRAERENPEPAPECGGVVDTTYRVRQ